MTNLLLLGNSFPHALDGDSLYVLSVMVIPAFITKHTDLQLPRNVDRMRYKYKYVAIIYGIVCESTGLIYVGSTWDPVKRFNKHLIQSNLSTSNAALQSDIAKYGLQSVTVYIFTKVDIDRALPVNKRKQILHKVEQDYINMFTVDQLYNTINSASHAKH